MFKKINWRLKLNSFLASLFLLIVVLHIFGIFYFYENIWWYDVLLHGLGGFWVGSLVLIKKRKLAGLKKSFFSVIIIVGIIGVLWEFFEKLSDVYFGWRWGLAPLIASFSDSISDLIMDVVGGIASLGFIFFRKAR